MKHFSLIVQCICRVYKKKVDPFKFKLSVVYCIILIAQIQIIRSLLYYFDCSNRFALIMVRKDTRLLPMGQNNSKKYVQN